MLLVLLNPRLRTKKIHDEIQQLPYVNISDFYSGLPYEVSIEVSKDKLREYNLSFQDVASSVRGFSRNMSAGQMPPWLQEQIMKMQQSQQNLQSIMTQKQHLEMEKIETEKGSNRTSGSLVSRARIT